MAKVLRWSGNIDLSNESITKESITKESITKESITKGGLLAWLGKLVFSPEKLNYPKGLSGEVKVAQQLARELGDHWVLLNDINIKAAGGKTQIDHLLFGPHGIFCLETKNWNTASCNEQGDWFRLERGMWVPQKSPVEQTRAKLAALSKMFSQANLPHELQGIIVFANPGKFKFAESKQVNEIKPIGLPGLIGYLQQLEEQAPIYSDPDIEKFLRLFKL
ncbi:nuclease-related domain-containing protein [Desulfotomaculum sp. 1211_IL3151]|uniref:nuclease-related domain-containing protein n=1 Tax=Desulfotomaculum sp. 1211_IL3151 TaxID=3084055 RepID=UPI002FDB09FD